MDIRRPETGPPPRDGRADPGARSRTIGARQEADPGRSVRDLAGLRGGPDRPALRDGLPRGDRDRADAPRDARAGQAAGLPPGRSRRAAAPALPGRRPGARPGARDARASPSRAAIAPRSRPSQWTGSSSPAWPSTTGAIRLGRGAGHYDRLLPTLRPDAPRWALIARLPVGRGPPGRAARRPARRDRLAPHWGDSPGDHEGSSGGGSRRAPTAGLITELGPRASAAWRTSGRRLGGRPRRCRRCGG